MRSVIFLTIFCMLSVAFADTIHVPGDYPTIQKAIDAAVNGDTVLAEPNTYYEKIDFLGKNITVTSEGDSSDTILDAIGVGSVVTFRNGESNEAILDGFTIQNGSGTYDDKEYCGGGIYVSNASPDIVNCIIQDNIFIGSGIGAGIYISGGSPTVHDCKINNNSNSKLGGGIAIVDGDSSSIITSPTIINCTISNNNANVGGGGIFIRAKINYANVLIDHCTIESNHSGYYGGGATVESYAYCEISNCSIRNNSADKEGGGVYVNSKKDYYAYLHDNVINNNSLIISGYGAGISIVGHFYNIENNLICNNYSIDSGGGVSFNNTNKIYSPQIFKNNMIFKNKAENIGGGILFQNVNLDLINYTVSGNNADVGGGVSFIGNSNIFMANSILWNNEATTSNKNIYIEAGANVTIIYGCEFVPT